MLGKKVIEKWKAVLDKPIGDLITTPEDATQCIIIESEVKLNKGFLPELDGNILAQLLENQAKLEADNVPNTGDELIKKVVNSLLEKNPKTKHVK